MSREKRRRVWRYHLDGETVVEVQLVKALPSLVSVPRRLRLAEVYDNQQHFVGVIVADAKNGPPLVYVAAPVGITAAMAVANTGLVGLMPSDDVERGLVPISEPVAALPLMCHRCRILYQLVFDDVRAALARESPARRMPCIPVRRSTL